ncbi:MAG: YlbF family regulator [Brevefilum sp.]|nr:YlbF family regulator [Brevefilum sp.]
MEKLKLNELEIASKSVVMDSAQRFTEALAESPQFRAFEDVYQAFRDDNIAQTAYKALRDKQESLSMMMTLNAIDEEERSMLNKLESQFLSLQSVQRYIEAQNALIALCQEIGDIFSDAVGLNFGLACRVGGCCG